MSAPRYHPEITEFRQRRIALGFTAEEIARAIGWSRSKFLRTELNPARARHGDVIHLESTLSKLERAGAASALGSAPPEKS